MLMEWLLFSIIAQVNIEMRLLWLVEDCVISHHYDLTRGGYSRVLNLKITTLHFKRKVSTFCWLNQIILLQIIAYLDTSNHHDYNKMCKLQCFHSSKNLWQNSKAPEQLLKQFFTSGSVNIVASQLYSVSGIIQQYSPCPCCIIVYDQTFRL